MTTGDERVIELSRLKLVMTIGGALLFVAAGAWFFLAPADGSFIRDMERFAPPWAIHALGVVAALFGIAGVVYGVRKSFDQKPGLVLGATGLVDNSSAVAAGFIPWSEITGLSLFQMRRQRMLIVHVADPEKYIARGNALQRMLNRANTGMVGSPISISSNALRIPFDELQREIASYLMRYGTLMPDAGSEDAAWDRKLEADVAAGRLDGLAADALAEHRAGRSRPL
jgi:hypothetical protein